MHILGFMKILLSMALGDEISYTYRLHGWSHSIG